MFDQRASSSESTQRQSALLELLRATLTLPAQVTFYAAALGAILLIPGMDLPPDLAFIASGIGVNALSSILEQIARGEQLTDFQIRTQVKAAIEESRITEKLDTPATQVVVDKLLQQSDVIKVAIQNGEREILQRLDQQAVQYQVASAEISDQISRLRHEVRQLATREQIESLLEQHLVAGAKENQLGDSLPPRAQQQLILAQCQAELYGDPSNWRAWLKQALAFYRLKENEKALAAIDMTWKLNKQDPDVVIARGCILAEYAIAKGGPRSMLYDAIDLFESLRDIAEEPAGLDYNIGNCYAGLGEHRKAVETFDRALAEEPDSELAAQIWKNRGSSCWHIEEMKDEEIDCYKRALELNPNLFEAYASWGGTEVRNFNYQRGRELLEKAFEVAPERELRASPQLYTLAYALWKLDELEEAYRRVDQVLALQPIHRDGLLLKAIVLSQLWRRDPEYVPDAIAFYEARAIDEPDDERVRAELHLIYRSDEYKHDARSFLEQTALSSSAPPQSLYHYALLLESEDELFEAVKYLEIAYRRSQEHHIVHSLGRLKKRTEDYQGAIRFYKMALQRVDNPVSILRDIADCHHFLEEYEECVRILARAILAEPRDEVLWNNLGYALGRLGRDWVFSVFEFYVAKLRWGYAVADEEVVAALDELLSRLRIEFGEEFVLAIEESSSIAGAR